MNPVASFEDELLHLGIPSLGLMAEMDARVQQFFNTNTEHSFPFVKSSPAFAGEPSCGSQDCFRCCYGPPHSHECRQFMAVIPRCKIGPETVLTQQGYAN
jgi:hypothetical protein